MKTRRYAHLIFKDGENAPVPFMGLLALILLAAGLVVRSDAHERPNLVLFLADDCTYRDIGCFGGTHSKTPAIDQLATEGMRFNKCYQAAPMCSPTRHNLYNGMYPVRTGAYPNHTFVDPWVKSMPHYLQNLGYRVGFLGKRHIGPGANYPFEYLSDKPKGAETIDLAIAGKFLAEAADSDRPFCLVVCSHQPHSPYTVGDRSLFDASQIPVRHNIVDTPTYRKTFAAYLAEVNYMDGQVGTLLHHLKANSLDDNTLVVYLSEQGNSFPFAKWTCYEDGVKSAFVARWPGVIQPGTETDALVEYNDILPTFIAAAGGDIPKHLDGVSLLPIFKNPKLKGKPYAFSIHTTRGIIQGSDYFGIRSVTDGRYRYIYNISPEVEFSNVNTVARGADHWWSSWLEKSKHDPNAAELVRRYVRRSAEELYDSQLDPDNQVNLIDAAQHQDRRRQLRQAVLNWMEDCGDKGLETELLAFQRMKRHRRKTDPTIGEMLPAMIPNHQPAEQQRDIYVPGRSLQAQIEIPADGFYTFHKSRKKSLSTSILIDGHIVLSDANESHYGIVGLKRGMHRIEIIADKRARETPGDIRWSGPNQLIKPLESADFRRVD